MSEVNLRINGRNYPILCDDGQEARIKELAGYIDSRLKEISESGAASNDNHLLVLTSLILADEIFSLKDNLNAAEGLLDESRAGFESLAQGDEDAISEAINSIANRIELLSSNLKKI